MPDEPDLFDFDAAKRGRADGMARADEAADEDWKAAAEVAVITAAKALPLLTSDDVMRCIDPTVSTHELRAMGPVMMRAAKAGWIEKANLPGRLSQRPSLHASPRTVWKSLLFTGDGVAA